MLNLKSMRLSLTVLYPMNHEIWKNVKSSFDPEMQKHIGSFIVKESQQFERNFQLHSIL